MAVIIETSIGELTVDLYSDERPRCSKNFLKLCKVKYYNFCLFHSVQPNLVAQTGDPTATGRGGMSVYGMVYGDQASYFDMEVTPRIKHKKRGLLSMVNNGNGRHGSQFFITLGADLDYLDGEHTVFGEVAEGFEVLDKLNDAYCDDKHRPYRDIRIFHTVIIDDPFDDPEGLVIPDKSPEPTKEMLESDRIGVDEEVDDTKGMTEKEIQELQETREAKANAQLLEMVGDIPDEDVKPPDNVLFVCKLNPVTTDEDLEMIFSRFGPIVSCEVIKDHKTKESLQYAFVEFEKPEHCENAYFKMDNVLIDDRRIHVDFSQSVSKLRMPMASGKKAEEEKKVDQPKYVLKDQQRQDNNYDLVFEHDLPEKSPERKKSKKHKHRKLSNSDDDGDAKERKKARRQGEGSRSESRSRSPQGRERDGTAADRASDDQPYTQRGEKERERRRSSSSQEDRRKERKRDRKTSPTEEGSKKERRKERKRSPSMEEDRKKEKRRKERSPSSDKDRKKHKKRKERSPSSEQDKRKKRRNRSPSTEEDRRKKKKRSTSSDEDRKRKKKEKRSSSEDRKKERRRKERSPSLKEERRKKKKERRHSSSEEDDSRERKKEERRRGDYSSSSYRDRGDRDRR